MENPWIEFIADQDSNKFHPKDRANALGFNRAMIGRDQYLLAEHLQPFPYLGRPESPVIVLLANPGKSNAEAKKSFKLPPKKLQLANDNLLHNGTKDLRLRLHSPGHEYLESFWFKARTKQLVLNTSIESVAQNLFFINFHAYHSKSWYPIPFTFHTQHYSFNLLRKSIKQNAMIIMSRNTLGWMTAVPELSSCENLYHFRSSRSVHLSEGNLGTKAFKEIINRFTI